MTIKLKGNVSRKYHMYNAYTIYIPFHSVYDIDNRAGYKFTEHCTVEYFCPWEYNKRIACFSYNTFYEHPIPFSYYIVQARRTDGK